jgi:hypothetical protein
LGSLSSVIYLAELLKEFKEVVEKTLEELED